MLKTIGTGIAPAIRSLFNDAFMIGGSPFIRGVWYFVDPTSGSNANDGLTVASAKLDLLSAYTQCISGAGDGICLLSRGTGTASETTSYLTQELLWTKHGITLFGACAPIKSFQRSRIANKAIVTTAALSVITGALTVITRASSSFLTDGWVAGMKFTAAGDQTTSHVVASVTALTLTATTELVASAGGISSIKSYNVNLITLSGANNVFANAMFWNGGTSALEIGGVVDIGARNAFVNCHLTGGAGAAAAATKYSLKLDAAEEDCFYGCTIGSDSFDHGNNADVELILNGVVKRNRFIDCEFLGYVSAGTAHGAIKSVSTSGGSPTLFKDCAFNYGLSVTTPAAAHLVSGSTDRIILQDCSAFNVSAWGTQVRANMVAAAATAGGGLGTNA